MGMRSNVAERAYRWAGEEGQQVDCPSWTSSEGQKRDRKFLMLKITENTQTCVLPWREMILMEQTLDVCEEEQEEELRHHHNHD